MPTDPLVTTSQSDKQARPDPLAKALIVLPPPADFAGYVEAVRAALDAAGYEVRPKSDRDEYAANMARLVEQVDDCARELARRPKLTAERLAAALRASMEPSGYGYIDINRNTTDAELLGEATLILAALDDAP